MGMGENRLALPIARESMAQTGHAISIWRILENDIGTELPLQSSSE
jgi:1,2-phenylacetyl-CoA epoxidase PaaB subunit